MKKNAKESLTQEAREARKEYRRKWYAQNREKQTEYTRRYWEKKESKRRRANDGRWHKQCSHNVDGTRSGKKFQLSEYATRILVKRGVIHHVVVGHSKVLISEESLRRYLLGYESFGGN